MVIACTLGVIVMSLWTVWGKGLDLWEGGFAIWGGGEVEGRIVGGDEGVGGVQSA